MALKTHYIIVYKGYHGGLLKLCNRKAFTLTCDNHKCKSAVQGQEPREQICPCFLGRRDGILSHPVNHSDTSH